MLIKRPIITELWLYENSEQITCLVDQKSGEITANIFKIPLDNIIYISSFNVRKGYMKFIHINGKEYFKKISLKEIVSTSNHFAFVSKDTIVNTLRVNKRCNWHILWIDEHKFKISRRYRQRLIEIFNLTIL